MEEFEGHEEQRESKELLEFDRASNYEFSSVINHQGMYMFKPHTFLQLVKCQNLFILFYFFKCTYLLLLRVKRLETIND